MRSSARSEDMARAVYALTAVSLIPVAEATWVSGRSAKYRSTTTSRCRGGRVHSAEMKADRSTSMLASPGPLGSRARWAVGREPGRELVHYYVPPQRGPGPVDDRPAQVGQRVLGVGQPPPGGVHGHERVLHDFLRRGQILHQQRGDPDQRPVVGQVERGHLAVGVLGAP